MIDANLYDLISVLNGEIQHAGDESSSGARIQGAFIDSRKLTEKGLFFAFEGERVDGHDFLQEAKAKGASAAVVERFVDVDLPQLKVSSARLALGQLATWWRDQLACKIIALTGSNGKTTVKEMLASICSQAGKTASTQGNLNNDLGMPLTLLSVGREHKFAVLEMGANHFGEIDYLTHIARPDVALINNAGPAHLEGFGDIAGVARAKGEIYSGLKPQGVAIINVDDAYADYWRSVCADKHTMTFSLDDRPTKVQGQWNRKESELVIRCNNKHITVKLNVLGEHNARNALAAATTALAAGLEMGHIQGGLEAVRAVPGRLELHQIDPNTKVLDDTYNANPASVLAGVDAAKTLVDGDDQVWMVLGDLGELGEDSQAVHFNLGAIIKEKGVQRLFTLGQQSAESANAFGKNASAHQELESLIQDIQSEKRKQNQDLVILVKGSRSSRMERVVHSLVESK